MILIDREVDLVTPMMTQITFEGLIDEVTGIKYGAVAWQPRGACCCALLVSGRPCKVEAGQCVPPQGHPLGA